MRSAAAGLVPPCGLQCPVMALWNTNVLAAGGDGTSNGGEKGNENFYTNHHCTCSMGPMLFPQ
ncbi:hypothetical protein BV22DRAFT_1034608 [Leucogyrophana mollusca]|uniref:Uncharacterized protein n=1 Tax=Leucogyrophana mollusca TaxID=85980 RepID=A0ACB8BH73_9AGAM|nr:hypothetical protein BV22DRAFT_1034608 [Leucogyrophana mollusca]